MSFKGYSCIGSLTWFAGGDFPHRRAAVRARSVLDVVILVIFDIHLDRHAGQLLAGAERQRGLHVGDVRCRGEAGGQEFLEGVPILGDHLQQEVGLPGQHVALAHLGPVLDHFLEGDQIVLGLAVQADESEDRDLVAERLRIDVRVVAANETGLFEIRSSLTRRMADDSWFD